MPYSGSSAAMTEATLFSYQRVTSIAADTAHATVGGPFGSSLLAQDYVASGVPVIRGQNLAQGRWVAGDFVYVSEAKAQELFQSWARPGDIVFTQRGTLGQVALIPALPFSRYVVSQSQMKLTVAAEKADSLFLYYAFSSPEFLDYINNNKVQTGVPHINLGILRGAPIPLPPLSTQRAIAYVLGSLDDKIELNGKMIATLEQLARSLYKSWFVDFDPVRAKSEGAVPCGLDAQTAELFPDRFASAAEAAIPLGWSRVPLAQVAVINRSYWLPAGSLAPYVEMSSLSTRGHRARQWPLRAVGSGARFKNGDTLVARITPCLENGKAAFVDFLANDQIAWGSTEYVVITPLAPFPAVWAYLLVRDPKFREYAVSKMEGSTGRQRVPAAAIASYQVIRPTESVGLAFGRYVSPLFARIKGADEESQTLTALRDALLPRLLSGALRIPDAERLVSRLL